MCWWLVDKMDLEYRRSLLVRPLDISTRMRVPQHRVPSKPRTESSASRGSSNSTNANPGGFLATHTFLMFPYFENTFSISYLDAFVPRLPT